MFEWLSQPWPWYVAGPLIGLIVPFLLVLGGRQFGISSSFRDICAATVPGRLELLRYDWRESSWRLAFVAGILAGGALAAWMLPSPDPYIAISPATVADLEVLGVEDLAGLVPDDLIGWSALATLPGFIVVVVGGFLVGFGTRYAGGCTSGHGITGLASLQLPSLIAVAGFFVGGLIATHLLLPVLL